MISNNELKYIQSFAHKKHWAQESVFIIEGPKMLEEAIKAKVKIEKIYATKNWMNAQEPSVLPITEVSEDWLAKISQLQTANQVLALVKKEESLSALQLDNQFTIVLDGIQDPGNLGTIIRTADWFGVNQMVVSEDTAQLYNPKVIQSTMGSCFRVQVKVMALDELFTSFSIPVLGAVLSGTSIYKKKLPEVGFLLIGNESKGIRPALQQYISDPVSIPRFGGAESLNAAVATGIILSHWKK